MRDFLISTYIILKTNVIIMFGHTTVVWHMKKEYPDNCLKFSPYVLV